MTRFCDACTWTALWTDKGCDVNVVRWFPDGHGFVAGCEDGTVRLVDVRTGHQMNEYALKRVEDKEEKVNKMREHMEKVFPAMHGKEDFMYRFFFDIVFSNY